MYKQEQQIKPYEGTGDKGKLVEEMFDNIAPTYDTLNHRLRGISIRDGARRQSGVLRPSLLKRCSTSLPVSAISPS